MEKYPNSFVGFFDTIASVLRNIGQEWLDYAFTTQNPVCNTWGKTFIEAAETIDLITIQMSKIRDEHDANFKSIAETK